LLVLLAYPCQDCGDHRDCRHKASQTDSQNNQDDNQCDHCSPFCVCNCCNVPAMISVHMFQGNISDLIIPLENEFIANTSEGVTLTVWQPPKLS
jgi:hypothetical protein